MKINPIVSQLAISAYKMQRTLLRSNEIANSADQVSFSEAVVSMSSTISKIKELLDIRTPEELAHIEKIARLIHSGSYHVDSGTVAGKIVDDFLNINK